MILPDIKVNIDPKHAVYAAVALCAAGFLISIGYMLAQQPEEVVCKNYINQLKAANTQVSDLERDLSSKVSEASLECIAREKEACSSLVEATAENIKRLRCRICNSKGVR